MCLYKGGYPELSAYIKKIKVNVKYIFKQHTNSQEHSNVVFQNALVVSN